jgi:hypothetical protein
MGLPHRSLGQLSDPATAWVRANQMLLDTPGAEQQNVIFSIPISDRLRAPSQAAAEKIDEFLKRRGFDGIGTVARTIFPTSLYARHGWPEMEARFHELVLPQVSRTRDWSGYYFDRMTRRKTSTGETVHPLNDVIRRMRETEIRNRYELAIFNPELDLSNASRGGHCMSHLSFKLNGDPKRIDLTAVYRLHYYAPKLLGNLIGRNDLVRFVSAETGYDPGTLTIVSVNATLGGFTKAQLRTLIRDCDTELAAS